MKCSEEVLRCTAITPDRTDVYVIRGDNGDLLIDTGIRTSLHQIDRWIKRNKFEIKWIFLTHGHFDHTWNARFFKQKYGAEVIIHEKDKNFLTEGEHRKLFPVHKMTKASERMFDSLLRKCISPYCRADYILKDGDTDFLKALGFDAEVVMLPGHTEGSMGILQNKVLYCGDAIAAKKGKYYITMLAENKTQAYETEKKIFSINPEILAPGHGRLVIRESSAQEIR